MLYFCVSIRERVDTLAIDNEVLRDQMRQTEKDTIDVVSFLKKQDLDKDTEVKIQTYFDFNKNLLSSNVYTKK